MKIAALIARILLGLEFLVFGANILLHFLPQPPMAGDAGVFATILAVHGFMNVVGLIQIVGGILLLVGRFVPFALTILGPIVVNILLFHIFLAPSGLPIALVTLLLEVLLIAVYRKSFYTLFHPAPEVF